MTASRVPLARVKEALSEYVRDTERGHAVVITRHGKDVAALVPAADLAALERLRAAGPAGGLASVAGGWRGSDDFLRRVAEHRRTGYRASRTRP